LLGYGPTFTQSGIRSGSGGMPFPFCISKPSSIPGCIPTLSASGTSVAKSPGNPFLVTAGPVPGGGNPGTYIYSKHYPANPINTQFGWLCLQSFLRSVQFSPAGGVSGTCSGSYVFDLNIDVSANAGIVPGDAISMQCWYRDPPNPGTANFTSGFALIPVVP